MKSPTKSIFVVMATYNGELYLQEQVDSILSQVLPSEASLYLLISDDGSIDGTPDIIARLSGLHENVMIADRAEVIQRGPASNFQFLLERAITLGADYVALADQDDVWHPGKIFRAYESVSGAEGASAYLGSATLVDANLNLIGRIPGIGVRTSLPSLLLSNQRAGMTFFMNQAAIKLVVSYAETRVIMHDWWFELVLLASGSEVFEDDHTYVLYRQHDSNVMGISRGYRNRIRKARSFAIQQFQRRSVQSKALIETGLLTNNREALEVSNFILPLRKSTPSLLRVLLSRNFFSNRQGFHKIEARILLILTFLVYHFRKRFK